jgi:hypothetical protein
MSSQTELRLNAAGSFVLGLSADVGAVVATQPMDVVKTYVQKGEWDNLRSQFRHCKGFPPVGKLWHGSLANCVGAIPQGGLPFLINALAEEYIFKSKQLTDPQLVSNGMMTGVLASCLIAPFDRVSKEHQLHGGTAIDACRRTVREHGILGLFKAIKPIAIRDSIVFGTFFGARKVVENRLQEYVSHDGARETIASAATGAFAGVLSNPLDRANTLIQSDKEGLYPTIRSTFQRVIGAEGIRGLAKGAGTRSLFMGAYYIALGYASERIKPYLPQIFWKETSSNS